MHKTYGRIPEDTIVDLKDKKFYIGPFYKNNNNTQSTSRFINNYTKEKK